MSDISIGLQILGYAVLAVVIVVGGSIAISVLAADKEK
jgi:hypothetical protein